MKKNIFRALLFALILGSLAAFKPVIMQRQGITGHLYKISGNQMPSPDIKQAPPKGIKGVIYVYELTNLNQAVKKEGSFYSSVSTRLVKKIQTNSKGYFNVQLPPGKYSVFIKKDTLLYSNRFDSQSNIGPVEITKGKMTQIEVRLDYSAVY